MCHRTSGSSCFSTRSGADATARVVHLSRPIYHCGAQPLRGPAWRGAVPIRADELSIEPLSDGFGLLWLPVEEYSNGDRTLLVALVHTSKRALSVLGIGTVRLPPEQIASELQDRSRRGHSVSRKAPNAARVDSGKCDRRLKLLLLHDGRFVPLEMRDADNECHGEAAIDLARSQQVRLKSGLDQAL